MREEDGLCGSKRVVTWLSHGTYSTALGAKCCRFCPGRPQPPVARLATK